MKDGTFISGSITSQTEYTLNVTTSYGPVVLNQREVEAILPDQHRVHLKGGSELVGVIVDLDEFNLKLQTDEGVVNIDMPQIVSVEVYDYEQGSDKAQKLAAQQAQAREQEETAALTAATVSGSAAAGGLTFDSDIEKVFDTKKPDIVNGQVQTVREISAAEIRAKQAAAMSEEEAFLKGVPSQQEAAVTQAAAAARSGKLEKEKKAAAKKAKRPNERAANKFFSITVGAQRNGLKLDNSDRAGFENEDSYDVGGTSVRAEASFLWRLGGSNFWLGPTVAIANISKTSFQDLDPAVISAPPGTYDPNVDTSGQMIDAQLKANYYFNPQHLFVVYATATGGCRFLTLNYHGGIKGENINTTTPLGSVGLGVQTIFDDLLIGLEVTEQFSPYSKDFKDSSTANTVASVTFSWKF